MPDYCRCVQLNNTVIGCQAGPPSCSSALPGLGLERELPSSSSHTMGRASFGDFGQVLLVGFPSAPAASGSFCNFKPLLATQQHSWANGSRRNPVSRQPCYECLKHRQMKGGTGQSGNPTLSWLGTLGFSMSLGDLIHSFFSEHGCDGNTYSQS